MLKYSLRKTIRVIIWLFRKDVTTSLVNTSKHFKKNNAFICNEMLTRDAESVYDMS